MPFHPVGVPIRVNTSTLSPPEGTAFTVGLAGGEYVVLWQSAHRAASSPLGDVSARIFDATGNPTTASFTILDNWLNDTLPRNVSAAALPNGGFAIASRHVSADNTSDQLVLQTFNAAGTAVSAVVAVTNSAISHREPEISVVGDHLVVVWREGSAGDPAYARLYDFNGSSLSGAIEIDPGRVRDGTNTILYGVAAPAVAALASGGFAAVWEDYRGLQGDNSISGIRARLFDRSGVAIGESFLVNTATIGAQFTPHIASLGNGNFVVIWGDTGSGTEILKGQLFNPVGAPIGGEFFVADPHDTSTGGLDVSTALAPLSNGGFVVTWSEHSTDQIYVREFNGSAEPISAATSLPSAVGGINAISPLADGGYVVDWNDRFGRVYTQRLVHSNVANDFNGDGRSDLFWRNDNGLVGDWLGSVSGTVSPNAGMPLTGVSTDWHLAATGDFDGDGRSDLLWRNDNGALGTWRATAAGGFTVTPALTSVPTDWKVAGTGDFNGDGRVDILWRNVDGTVGDWLSVAGGGFASNAGSVAAVPTSWKVVGTGDFNGDGRDDILWRNIDGTIGNWFGNANGGFTYNPVSVSAAPTSWQVAGVGDFNGDGRADILWRSDGGAVGTWFGTAAGAFFINPALVQVPLDWHIAAVGDYSGDGLQDILWRNDNGAVGDWLATSNGSFAVNNTIVSVPTNWHVEPVALI